MIVIRINVNFLTNYSDSFYIWILLFHNRKEVPKEVNSFISVILYLLSIPLNFQSATVKFPIFPLFFLHILLDILETFTLQILSPPSYQNPLPSVSSLRVLCAGAGRCLSSKSGYHLHYGLSVGSTSVGGWLVGGRGGARRVHLPADLVSSPLFELLFLHLRVLLHLVAPQLEEVRGVRVELHTVLTVLPERAANMGCKQSALYTQRCHSPIRKNQEIWQRSKCS